MNIHGVRIGMTAAAVLLLAATAACGGGATAPATGTGRPAAPSPPATVAPTVPSSAATAAPRPTTPEPADTAACFDGSCEITVTKPVTIRVDGDRFGFSSFTITRIGASGVTVEARAGGAYLRSGVSPGGTAGLNNLSVRVKSVRGHTADLVLSRRD